MIQLFLGCKLVLGALILESAWERGDCDGQPSIMTLFSDTNTSALWNILQQEYYYPYCGCDYNNLYSGCCISSLSPNDTLGYQSITYVVQNDQISTGEYWTGANNQYYCVYSAINGEQLDWGYLKRYIKPNGVCYDSMKCEQNRLLIYNSSACNGDYMEIPLDSQNTSRYIAPLQKDIYASFIQFQGGSVDTIWTMFYPLAEVTPKFVYPMESIGLICYILALMLSMFAAYKELRKVLRKIEGAVYLFVAQVLWIIWIAFCFADWTSSYSSVQTMAIIDGLIPAIYNISTLLSMFATVGLIMKFMGRRHKLNGVLVYGLVLASHLVLAGGGYIFVFCFIPEIAYIFTSWYKLSPLWNLLLFLVNTGPPMIILGQIGNLYGFNNDIKSPMVIYRNLLQQSPIMQILLPSQVLNTVVYVALVVVLQFTELLKNDRNFMAWNGLIILSMIIHEVLNYWIKGYLSKLLELVGSQRKSTPDYKNTTSTAKKEDQ